MSVATSPSWRSALRVVLRAVDKHVTSASGATALREHVLEIFRAGGGDLRLEIGKRAGRAGATGPGLARGGTQIVMAGEGRPSTPIRSRTCTASARYLLTLSGRGFCLRTTP